MIILQHMQAMVVHYNYRLQGPDKLKLTEPTHLGGGNSLQW